MFTPCSRWRICPIRICRCRTARPLELLGKRATGYLNWWRHRVHLHVPEALAGIVADIKAQRPDHIALTGDLVNVSLPQEFARASKWLAAFDTPDRITVIPGNHDVYVATAWAEGLGLWGAYMAGDGKPPAADFEVFPTLRRRGRWRWSACRQRGAQAALPRHRDSRRGADRARRAAAWPIPAARASAASC